MKYRFLVGLMLALSIPMGTASAASHRKIRTARVPNVNHMPISAATKKIRAHHLRVGRIRYILGTRDLGQVARTNPRAGTRVKRGQRVGLWVYRLKSFPPPKKPSKQWHPVIGVGDVKTTDVVTELRNHNASTYRIIVNPLTFQYPDREALYDATVNEAITNGYKLFLSMQWNNSWPDDRIQSFVNQVLDHWGAQATWIALGNEQELNFYGWGIENGAQYSHVWKITEPIVASRFPSAIRVAGEIYPGGVNYLEDAWRAGLPGAQAIGAHPYGWSYSKTIDCTSFVNLWHSRGKLVYYDEGLQAPDGWPDGTNFPRWDIPLSKMGKPDGAMVWLLGKPTQSSSGQTTSPSPSPVSPQDPGLYRYQ